MGLLEGYDEAQYKELLSCRKYRSEKFPYEFSYECCGEEIEGSANYVEWQVLRQLDENEAENLVADMRKTMLQPEYFFPIRLSGYYTGALLINAMIQAGGYNYGSKNRSVIKQILESLVAANEVVLTGPVTMGSVNIYDARCYNGYLTSRFFLMYSENGEKKVIRDNYAIKMKDEKTIEKVYRWVS